jgi:hypothetical protein
MAKLKHQRREQPRRVKDAGRSRAKRLRNEAVSRAKLDRWRKGAGA